MNELRKKIPFILGNKYKWKHAPELILKRKKEGSGGSLNVENLNKNKKVEWEMA